mgnify:CR=1 FL=1
MPRQMDGWARCDFSFNMVFLSLGALVLGFKKFNPSCARDREREREGGSREREREKVERERVWPLCQVVSTHPHTHTRAPTDAEDAWWEHAPRHAEHAAHAGGYAKVEPRRRLQRPEVKTDGR